MKVTLNYLVFIKLAFFEPIMAQMMFYIDNSVPHPSGNGSISNPYYTLNDAFMNFNNTTALTLSILVNISFIPYQMSSFSSSNDLLSIQITSFNGCENIQDCSDSFPSLFVSQNVIF